MSGEENAAPEISPLAPDLQIAEKTDTAVSAPRVNGSGIPDPLKVNSKLKLLRRPVENSASETAEFQITLKLSVEDAGALWDAAAARARASIDDADDSDLEEMLGPREDPAVADCIALLASPAAIAGCELLDFAVDEGDADSPPAIVFPKR